MEFVRPTVRDGRIDAGSDGVVDGRLYKNICLILSWLCGLCQTDARIDSGTVILIIYNIILNRPDDYNLAPQELTSSIKTIMGENIHSHPLLAFYSAGEIVHELGETGNSEIIIINLDGAHYTTAFYGNFNKILENASRLGITFVEQSEFIRTNNPERFHQIEQDRLIAMTGAYDTTPLDADVICGHNTEYWYELIKKARQGETVVELLSLDEIDYNRVLTRVAQVWQLDL